MGALILIVAMLTIASAAWMISELVAAERRHRGRQRRRTELAKVQRYRDDIDAEALEALRRVSLR